MTQSTTSDFQSTPAAQEDSVSPMTEPKPAAEYIRISIDDKSGIGDQLFIVEQHAAKAGYGIPDDPQFRFVDNDATGTNSHRKAFERLTDVMVETINAKGKKPLPFDRLYVKDRTRLGRWNDPRMHNYVEVLCKLAGVTVCYCDEPIISYDDADAAVLTVPFLLAQLANLRASNERGQIVKRTREGSRSAAVKGRYPGSRPAYGMERWLTDKLTNIAIEKVEKGKIVKKDGCGYTLRRAADETSITVANIFRRFEEGETMNAIAGDLNRDCVAAPGATGNLVVEGCRWTSSAVQHILRNPIYVGDLHWGSDNRKPDRTTTTQSVVVQGKAPIVRIGLLTDAIVPRDRWINVQRRLERHSTEQAFRRANKAEFSVSSILRCASCGASLYGFTKKRAASGAPCRYYRHDSTQRHRNQAVCPFGNRYVRADEIEPVVDDILQRVLRDDSLLTLAKNELSTRLSDSEEQMRDQELDALRQTIAELGRQKKEAARAGAAATSATAKSTHNEVVEELSREQDRLTVRITAAEETQALRSRAKEQLSSTVQLFANLYEKYLARDAVKRKQVVCEVMEAIVVDLESRVIELRVRAA